jgi:transcription elongation factor-like protein
MNTFPMTAAGHSVLEDELERRIRVERPHILQRIQQAILDDSNLAENSEYQAVKRGKLLTGPGCLADVCGIADLQIGREGWSKRPDLVVEPQQVVSGQAESADWRLRSYTAMRSVPVVAVKPSREFGGSFI